MQTVTPAKKMADKVDLAKTRLSDVKLGQLPRWFSTFNLTPTGFFNGFWRGIDRYNAKYVNVKYAKITPLAHVMVTMLVVSYIFRFKQEKHHRVRKHHW